MVVLFSVMSGVEESSTAGASAIVLLISLSLLRLATKVGLTEAHASVLHVTGGAMMYVTH